MSDLGPPPGDHDPLPETEARLRRALAARADAVEPKEHDVSDLEARADDARRRTRRRRGWLAAAAAVLVVVGVAGVLLLTDDDGEDVSTEPPGTTTTTEAPTTTSTSTTSTTAVEDDGVPGWPGFTSRVFDDPEAAALAFATDVLGFADPALGEGTTEGSGGRFVVYPRPTAGVPTAIDVHDTGPIRGWVVTGAASTEGTIDEVAVEGSTISLSGSATAFEATVAVLVLDQEGNVLAESFTMAGANGEQGPYETTIDADPDGGTPFWVMIAEGDASGEGRFVWATTAALPGA